MVQQSGGNDSSTSTLVETLMQQAKQRVAEEFLEACEDDEQKRTMVLELCRKVLSPEQYNEIMSAERSEEEEEENMEGDSEEDEKNDTEHDAREESDEASSDDSIPTMKQIDDKPYTDGISAETGELPFEEFKDLLEPNEDQQEHSSRRGKMSIVPKLDSIRQFGKKEATLLVNSHHHVKHSGQLYSEEWLEGKIRNYNLGKIEKRMLLMCLQDTRISGAVSAVLGKICEDLDLQSLVKKAVEVWGVAENFCAVWARKPTDQYTNNIRICRQCEIFVARAYVCITTLKHTEVSDDLGNKLMSCFMRMEENLPRHLAKRPVRSRSTDSGRKRAPSSTSNSEPESSSTNLDENKSTSRSDISDGRIIESVCPKTGNVGDDFADNIGDKQRDTRATSPKKKSGETASTRPQQSQKPTNLTGAESCTPLSSQAINKDSSGDTGSDRIIEQVHPDTGDVLGEFSSVTDIIERIGHTFGKRRSERFTEYIDNVLKGKRKTFCTFIWRYKGQTGKSKTDNQTEANGDSRADRLCTTAQNHRKRKASDDADVPPASKKSKQNQADRVIPSSISDDKGNHDSVNDIKSVPGNAYSRLLRAITDMPDIKESPYLKEQNAEVGEELFDSFKDMLIPRGAGRDLDASLSAKDLFGEALARQMVTVNSAIAKSGMVYGSAWKNGDIHGKNFGQISTYLLLLCLQEQRLASGSTSGLSVVVTELKVVDMVKDAIEAWKLESEFPLLKGMKSPSSLHSKTKALLGCMIFVARSYRCMKALKRNEVGGSIMTKVRKCLALVNSSLEQKQAREVAQEQSVAPRTNDKSEQIVGQTQEARTHQSELVEDEMDPKALNPGFIMHNLLLKPARVSVEPVNKKPKPIIERRRAANPPAPSFTDPSTANKTEGKKLVGQDSEQKKTLQSKQRVQSQPASKAPKKTQQRLKEPTQNSCLRTNQQKQAPAPTNSQCISKSHPSRTQMEHSTPVPTRHTPNNTPNPMQSINQVPLEPIRLALDGNWYPPDEMGILNDTETELAYLTTEGSFALRLDPSAISWSFIWEYASPLLKKELRQSTELGRLVRLDDGFVRKRFEFLKKHIQIQLNLGKRRVLMDEIIPVLRRKSRLANKGRATS